MLVIISEKSTLAMIWETHNYVPWIISQYRLYMLKKVSVKKNATIKYNALFLYQNMDVEM